MLDCAIIYIYITD